MDNDEVVPDGETNGTGLRLRQLKGNLYRIYTSQGSSDVSRDELWREMNAYAWRMHGMAFDFDAFSQRQVRQIRRHAVSRLSRTLGPLGQEGE